MPTETLEMTQETADGMTSGDVDSAMRWLDDHEEKPAVSAIPDARAVETEIKPKEEVAKPAEAEKTPDSSGTPAAKADAPAKAETPPEPTSKFAKEQKRRDDSWKAVNAEKEAVKAERESIAKERAEWKAQQEAAQAAKPEFTAEDYEAAAEGFEKDGKFEHAEAARAKALELKSNPSAAKHATISKGQAKSWQDVAAKYPEIVKIGSPANLAAQKLAQQDAAIWELHPNAPMLVAEMVMTGMKAEVAARVPELEGKLKTAEARIKELEALVEPGGGGSAVHHPGPKSFDDMSLDEQGAWLKAQAEQLDGRQQ